MSVLALTAAVALATPTPEIHVAPTPRLELAAPTCTATRAYATMGVVTTGVVATGMIAPMVLAPNTEIGPTIALGTAAVSWPMWIVSGTGMLATARRCGDPKAYVAGSMLLAAGASVPLAAGVILAGAAADNAPAGGLGALALGAAGIPAVLVGTFLSGRVMVTPMAGGKPGLTVSGRF